MSIHPTLKYTDARAVITFLSEALGFREQSVIAGADGRVQHAVPSFGGDAVLLGTRDVPPGPWDTGRAVTYLAVDDPDAAHARAVSGRSARTALRSGHDRAGSAARALHRSARGDGEDQPRRADLVRP